MAQLAGDKINGKEIMVYIHCQGQLEGDLGAKLGKVGMWMKKWEGPYPGTSKMDRRVEGNLEVMINLLSILKKPYDLQKNSADYQSPPLLSDQKYQTFCGT